ncbi:DeoR/GlpR family DNA-binding transcription regulator [Litoreibacter janthinus]|uniref:Transcriptional regulator, DeoR family n=1 Tax=Litoreibacter janthinus TaxID=670154 RepID=A0A1I6GVG8_9RHOB|nr:DeoR/GlpR family DNA-binding transcription regulator [Litoreibacter janthinus]SFR46136.1 transcriptional regulator, DeoR family [Litoreibacter janthinus]
MKKTARQSKMIELVREKEKASVDELSALLDISPETVRRDLSQLSKEGKIHKFHGGATLPTALGEGEFRQRMSENVVAKTKIATTAAGLFKPGETLLIDTGSTTLFFAEELAKRSGLTVITNSAQIARAISQGAGDNRVFLVGGEYNADNNQTFGAMAATQIRAFRAHHAVVTVGAIDARTGAMDFSIDEAQIARVMIEQASEVTVLADASKFDKLASFEVCPLPTIDRLVCDRPPPNDVRDALCAAGGQVVIAK